MMEVNLLRSCVPYATAAETDAFMEKIDLHKDSLYLHWFEGGTLKDPIGKIYLAMQPRALIQYSDIPCDGLNAIQAVRVTQVRDRRTGAIDPRRKKGKNPILVDYAYKPSERFDGFVDGGKFSPMVLTGTSGHRDGSTKPRPPVDPTKPYFCKELTAAQKKANWVSHLTDQSPAALKKYDGIDWEKSLVVEDAQLAAIDHERAFFTTFIIATNYKKSGRDKILKKFFWRFYEFGTVPKHATAFKGKEPRASLFVPAPIKFLDNTSPTIPERGIIRNDYPDYKFYGED